MQRESAKLLEDIRDAGAFILASVEGKTLEMFQNDRLLYQAVERNFEIIGEALTRLKRTDAATVGQLSETRQIVAFRNIIVHGYDQIDREVVWSIAQNKLPILLTQVEQLLNQ